MTPSPPDAAPASPGHGTGPRIRAERRAQTAVTTDSTFADLGLRAGGRLRHHGRAVAVLTGRHIADSLMEAPRGLRSCVAAFAPRRSTPSPSYDRCRECGAPCGCPVRAQQVTLPVRDPGGVS